MVWGHKYILGLGSKELFVHVPRQQSVRVAECSQETVVIALEIIYGEVFSISEFKIGHWTPTIVRELLWFADFFGLSGHKERVQKNITFTISAKDVLALFFASQPQCPDAEDALIIRLRCCDPRVLETDEVLIHQEGLSILTKYKWAGEGLWIIAWCMNEFFAVNPTFDTIQYNTTFIFTQKNYNEN